VPSQESVIVGKPIALPASRDRAHRTGLLLGSLGVLAFSLTFPATKFALRGLDPWFVSFGRAVLASCFAALTLVLMRARLPTGREWRRLLVVAGGVVFGFPALSALALQSSSSSHSAVVIAVLPAATAVAGVLRSHERPSAGFWLAAAAGAGIITAYTLARAGGSLRLGDLYLLIAVAVCALGYAEGGLLARALGAPQTICWALLLSIPVTVPVAVINLPGRMPGAQALGAFVYVSLGSALLGFFAWYGGMSRAGVTRASQLQLAQTPLTLVWSALLLGERIGWTMAAVAVAVLACIAATQRARTHAYDRTAANASSARSMSSRLMSRWVTARTRRGSTTCSST
jgi:drug/metabolite transporter (DMT)-like permease